MTYEIMLQGRSRACVLVNTGFQLQNLLKSREPGTFFGGGIVAGLLWFLLWFAFLPSTGKTSFGAEPDAKGKQGQTPLGADGAVLSSITGGPDSGRGSSSSPSAQMAFGEGDPGLLVPEGEAEQFLAESGDPYPGEAAWVSDAPPAPEGFHEAPAEIDGEPLPAPVLQAWFVEVLGDGKQAEILEVNAQSPEHALAIIRDYRGNPRVIRGPSTQPLD